jgi:hypothetical protein
MFVNEILITSILILDTKYSEKGYIKKSILRKHKLLYSEISGNKKILSVSTVIKNNTIDERKGKKDEYRERSQIKALQRLTN